MSEFEDKWEVDKGIKCRILTLDARNNKMVKWTDLSIKWIHEKKWNVKVAQLCLTLCDADTHTWTAACQVPLSLEFSRQEHWIKTQRKLRWWGQSIIWACEHLFYFTNKIPALNNNRTNLISSRWSSMLQNPRCVWQALTLQQSQKF